jgi:hypothetical protein
MQLLIILLLSTIHTLFSQKMKCPPFNNNIKTILSKTIKMVPIFQLGSGFNCNLMIYTAMKRIIITKSSIVITIGITLKSQKKRTCRVLTTNEFRITTTLSTPYKSTPTTHYLFQISLRKIAHQWKLHT